MGIFFEFQRSRPTCLHRVAKPVQQTEPWISSPRKNEFFRAPHADHLIVDDVCAKPDQRQIAALLANNLVPGRKWHKVTEPLKRHTITVMHKLSNGFPEGW